MPTTLTLKNGTVSAGITAGETQDAVRLILPGAQEMTVPRSDIARLERAVALGAGFRSDPWEVTELTLWRSHLTARGPQYEVLVRYPLGQGPLPMPLS